MKRNSMNLVVSTFAMLTAVAACVLPGRAQPVTDPNSISTAIAGTSQAAVEQTAVAQLFTPTPEARTGTEIEQISDGTTRYLDYDAGFEVTFPVGWLAVRPNSDEFNSALAGLGAVNAVLHDQLVADQSGYEADADRLYSYVLRPDIQTNVMFGFSKTKWDPDDSRMLDNTKMEELIRELESQKAIPGFHVDTAQIYDETGVRVIQVGGRWALNDGQTEPIPFYSIFYFFKPTQDSTVRITITVLQDYQDELAADMESIRDSIKLIEQ